MDDTYGNPENPLRYTSKSLRNIVKALEERGITICHTLVGQLVNILVQRNHNSGNLETGIPDTGNRLNSA